MRISGQNFKNAAAPFVNERMKMAAANVRNLGVVSTGPKAPAPTR